LFCSTKDVAPLMQAVGYVKKDWLESPALGNLKVKVVFIQSHSIHLSLILDTA
jgi:hypothetical protein